MKTLTLLLLVSVSIVSWNCQHADAVENIPSPTTFSSPSFNQVNTTFNSVQVSCLIDQWTNKTYQNEPVVFRVINDNQAYAAFFSCNSTAQLPIIDFSKNSLLIGMKSDDSPLPEAPVIISSVTQSLTPVNNGNYTLDVVIAGESGKLNPQSKNWFAFSSIVPKITGTVSLNVNYQIN